MIAESGMDDVRIARIATLAGVSPALVHYHFATREALLAEALEHSFELLGDFRTTAADDEGWTAGAPARLDDRPVASLPRHGRPRMAAVARAVGTAARRPELRPVAAQLYARYDAWIDEVVEEGIAAGEFSAPDAAGRRPAARGRDRRRRPARAGRRSGDDELPRARRLMVEQLAADLGTEPEAFA